MVLGKVTSRSLRRPINDENLEHKLVDSSSTVIGIRSIINRLKDGFFWDFLYAFEVVDQFDG